MRVVLLLLLFQFISPAFLPVAAQSADSQEEQTPKSLHAEHSSILLPILLKEKEENEYEEDVTTFPLTQLIDFADHSLALAELHESKYDMVYHGLCYDYRPPLFTLFCTFII